MKLEVLRPLRMAQDTHDGFPVTVLELQHRGISLMDNRASTGTTTFFIVRVPRQSLSRRIGWKPRGYQLSLDDEYLYMARAGHQPAINQWRRHLGLTTQAAAALVDDSHETRTSGQRQSPPVDNVQDPKIVLTALIVFGLLPALMVAYGAAQIGDLLKHDFLLRCARPAEYGTVLFGRDAWLFIAMLMLPLPGLVMMLVTMSRGMGRKRFAWRIIVDGILIVALAATGMHFATSVEWRPSLKDGTEVSCYANIPDRKTGTAPP